MTCVERFNANNEFWSEEEDENWKTSMQKRRHFYIQEHAISNTKGLCNRRIILLCASAVA